MAIANKYFGNDYLDVRSKMGFPDKDKVEKPNWKPLEAKNTNMKSDFAKMIEAEEVPEVTPQVIKFGEDVKITDISDGFKLYSANNPANDIFELEFHFNYGLLDDPDLQRASSYWSMQGTEDMNYQEFALELQKMGASIYTSTDDNEYVVSITGFEKDQEKLLEMCYNKLFHSSNDESQIAIQVEGEKMEIKTQKDDASTWARAVKEYALYGDRSIYLNRMSLKEWSKRSGSELLAEVTEPLKYDGYVTYSGNQYPEVMVKSIKAHRILPLKPLHRTETFRLETQFTGPQVFFAPNKKFRQSNIWFHVPGEKLSLQDEALASLFSKYFGTDMYSIVFQEIREFRSLGYTAYANYDYDYLERKPGQLYGFLGTQGDKTFDGIDAFSGLIKNMPERIEKFNASKEALLKSRASNYISFRNKPNTVQYWIKRGYDHDPRAEFTAIIRKAEFKDVMSFYERNIENRPVIIMMSGPKNVDKKALSKYGEVTKLKYKQIIKE